MLSLPYIQMPNAKCKIKANGKYCIDLLFKVSEIDGGFL